MTSDDIPSADTTELMCPWCQRPFGITLSMAGSTVHCPHCEREVAIPSREDLLALMGAPPVPPPVATNSDSLPPPPVAAAPAVPPIPTTEAANHPGVTTDAPPPRPVAAESPPLPPQSTTPAVATAQVSPPKQVHVQSRDGDAVAFHARGKIIRTAHGDVELRERSRGERSLRRSVRNVVLVILCLVVLLGLPAWLLSQKPKPPRSPLPSPDSNESDTTPSP
jgi:hypothetical protein